MEGNNGIGALGRQSYGSSSRHYMAMASANTSYALESSVGLNQTMASAANITNTTLPPDMTFGAAQIISVSAYTPLFFISAFLNLRVLRKLWHTKHSNGLSRLNQLLMHLVLADLSVVFLMMPLEIIWALTVSWWAGDILCRVCSFFRIFGLFLSSNIVVCISIDRFLAILKPFSVRGSSRRIKVMLATAWILAVILSLPQMVVFHVDSHPDYPWYEQCVTYGTFSSRLYEFLYFLMGMIFLYILPLVVILVTYGGIIIHLHKKSSPLNTCIKKVSHESTSKWPPEDQEDEDEITIAPPPPNVVGPKRKRSFMQSLPQFLELNTPLLLQRSSKSVLNKRNSSASLHKIEVLEMEVRRTNPGFIGKAKMNTIKITIALVGAFLACWTPYYVMCIWFWADPDSWEQIDYSVRQFFFIFACTNSCVNPLIYGAFTDKKTGLFVSKERICFMPRVRNRRWRANHLDDLEDGIELEARQSKSGRRSKSCSGSPNAYLKSKTVTAFMRTELHYKERSFHKQKRNDDTLRKFRHALSTPNLADNHISMEKDFNLITEVHMKRNDFMLIAS